MRESAAMAPQLSRPSHKIQFWPYCCGGGGVVSLPSVPRISRLSSPVMQFGRELRLRMGKAERSWRFDVRSRSLAECPRTQWLAEWDWATTPPTTKGMHGQAVVQIKNFHHLRRRAKHVDILTTGRWGLKAYRFPGQTRFIIIAFGIGGHEDETDDDKWSDTSVSSIAHANCRLQPSASRYLSVSSLPLAKKVDAQDVVNKLRELLLSILRPTACPPMARVFECVPRLKGGVTNRFFLPNVESGK